MSVLLVGGCAILATARGVDLRRVEQLRIGLLSCQLAPCVAYSYYTMVTTSADGLSSATTLDINGDATVDWNLTDVTVRNGDGSSTRTVENRSNDYSLRDKTVTTTSADGLSTTVATDLTGDGTADLVVTDILVLNGDGSQIETVAVRNADMSLRSQTITEVSASRRSTTITRDGNGDGATDQTETIVTANSGTVTDTVSNLNADGQVATTRAAAGLRQVDLVAYSLRTVAPHTLYLSQSIDLMTR